MLFLKKSMSVLAACCFDVSEPVMRLFLLLLLAPTIRKGMTRTILRVANPSHMLQDFFDNY
jgi:hypothetical protein